MALFRYQPKSRFLRQVITLSSGTAVAQAIAVGLLPVLTRLYTPQDFGVFTLYFSITSLLYVFGSLRYESMILLPRSHRAAAQLVRLVFFISIIVALISLLVVLLFRHSIAAYMGSPSVAPWLFFLPVSLFFSANYQALRYWMMRLQNFAIVSRGMIAKTGTNYTSAACLKMADAPLSVGGGLIVSAVFSDIINAAWLFWGCRKRDRVLFERVRAGRVLAMGRRHGAMAATLTLSHGVGALNSRLPSFMISAFFGSTSLGFFGVAERLAVAPSLLIASAIGDVYRQRASVLYQATGRFDRLMLKTLMMTSALAFIPYSIGILYGSDIFRILLGGQWEEAGRYASIIMISGFFAFVITPIDKGAIIVGARKYIIIWHVLRLVLKMILWGTLLLMPISIYQVLWTLVVIRISLYLLDLVMEYKYACGM